MAKEHHLDNERLLHLMESVANKDANSFDELCTTVRGILTATAPGTTP